MKRLVSTVAAVLMLAGCATPAPAPRALAPLIKAEQKIDFAGIQFEVLRIRRASQLVNWINQKRACPDMCTMVVVKMTNQIGAPLEFQFQPSFRLIDEAGAVYEPHLMNTLFVNMNQPGRPSYGQSLNPNVQYQQTLVFEVPERNFHLRVMVPDRARYGFGGSIATSGPYFLVDLKND